MSSKNVNTAKIFIDSTELDYTVEKLSEIKQLITEINSLNLPVPGMEGRTLCTKDVIKRFDISPNTVAAIFHAEDSPAYKVGAQWFIEEDELIDYLKKNTRKERELKAV
ncbi:helix-turn-helix domain-containing protein [Blautia pseudococcoides]|uniref:helix-turn-helix domain-containing protein n=1 Tax=Blautia pseudococcoides TaxID=1796616 RepID=UPI003513A135